MPAHYASDEAESAPGRRKPAQHTPRAEQWTTDVPLAGGRASCLPESVSICESVDSGPGRCSSKRSLYQARYRARLRAERAAEDGKRAELKKELEAAQAEHAVLAQDGVLLHARLDVLNEVSSILEDVDRGIAGMGVPGKDDSLGSPSTEPTAQTGGTRIPHEFTFPYTPTTMPLGDYESCCIMLRLIESAICTPKEPMGTAVEPAPQAVVEASMLTAFTPEVFRDMVRVALRADAAQVAQAHEALSAFCRKLAFCIHGNGETLETARTWYIDMFATQHIFAFQRACLTWSLLMRHRGCLCRKVYEERGSPPWVSDDAAFRGLLAHMRLKRSQIRRMLEFHASFRKTMVDFLHNLRVKSDAFGSIVASPSAALQTTRLDVVSPERTQFAEAVHSTLATSAATSRGAADYSWFLSQVLSMEQMAVLVEDSLPHLFDLRDLADRLVGWEADLAADDRAA